MVAKFVIAADGAVSSATIDGSTVAKTDVEQCVQRVFLSLTFPQPSGGGILVVRYPFVFALKSDP